MPSQPNLPSNPTSNLEHPNISQILGDREFVSSENSFDPNQEDESQFEPSFLHFEKPHCQSCGLLNDTPQLHGTNLDGSPSLDYCINCYQQGQFTQPDITYDVMATVSAGIIIEGHSEIAFDDMQAYMLTYLPTLLRWQNNQTTFQSELLPTELPSSPTSPPSTPRPEPDQSSVQPNPSLPQNLFDSSQQPSS